LVKGDDDFDDDGDFDDAYIQSHHHYNLFFRTQLSFSHTTQQQSAMQFVVAQI